MRYMCSNCKKAFADHEVIHVATHEYNCQKCFDKDNDEEDETTY